MRTYLSLTISTLTLTLSAMASAQWMTHSGGGTTTTGTFANGGQSYAGFVTTTLSNVVDGGSNGVPGLIPGFLGMTTGAFNANYPLNSPGNTFDFVSFAYNHTRDSYTATIDFLSLGAGYLPAGSTFAIVDLDIEEQFLNVRGYDEDGLLITSPWLSNYSGLKGFLDCDNFDGYQSNMTAYSWGFTSPKYDFVGIDHNETSSLLGFATTRDIAAISLDVSKYSVDAYNHNGGAGIGIAVVPEPATIGMLLLGLPWLARRRKIV